MSSNNPLQRITLKLPPKLASGFESPNGEISFDLPPAVIMKLAELGLKRLASDSIVTSMVVHPLSAPIDLLWEKINALSSN